MKNLLTSFLLLVFASAMLTASDWPRWRGPQRNGHVSGPTWPDKLDSDHLRLVWRVELGPSYSGPIVSGERVFTTETKDKKVEIVTAFDRHSGQVLWRAEWPGSVSVPFFAKSNGDWIRATPACDGESLFVAGMRDVLVCYHLKSQRVMAIEVETGRELWTSDTSFGKYWSLVAQGDRILALDQRGQLFLLRASQERLDKLDSRKLTGAETWAHLAVAGDQVVVRELNALAAFEWQSAPRPSAGQSLEPEPSDQPRVDSADLALLSGNWEGELEYLDFGDDRTKASIQAKVSCSYSVPDRRLLISLTFVEPGGKIVEDQASLEIVAEGRQLLFDGGEWTVTRKSRQPDPGGLTLAFERNGLDNGKPARLRNTISLAPGGQFTFTREARYANEGDYFARSTYRFKRAGS